jgi:hypothetical protein
MQGGWLGVGFLAAFLATSLTQTISSTPAPSTTTAQRILRRHIAAIGGETALANLHDFRLELVYAEGSFSAKSSLAQARPYFRLVSVPAGPLTKDSVLEGYDGAAWEYYGDPGVVLRTVGSAGTIARRNAHQFIDPLVDAGDNKTSLTYLGKRNADRGPVFVISARYADGTVDDVFVDCTTYLIDGLEQDIQFHAFGKNVTTHIVFDDYRPVGSVLMSFRSRQIENATGRVMDSSVITSAQANVGLKPSDFGPPAFVPTPLQAAIAAIYQERDDPGSCTGDVPRLPRRLRCIRVIARSDQLHRLSVLKDGKHEKRGRIARCQCYRLSQRRERSLWAWPRASVGWKASSRSRPISASP